MESSKLKKGSALGAERLQAISSELNDLVIAIKEVSDAIKIKEDAKTRLREMFFSLVDEYIEISGMMEREVLSVKMASRAEAEKYVAEKHPGWRIIQYDPNQIVIEEDPTKMRFTWTTEDGYQINRTTAVVGTQFDYEMLMDHDPDLFRQVVNTKTVYEIDEKKAQNIIDEHPHYLSILQDSTRLGKIQLRMSTPKKVSEE